MLQVRRLRREEEEERMAKGPDKNFLGKDWEELGHKSRVTNMETKGPKETADKSSGGYPTNNKTNDIKKFQKGFWYNAPESLSSMTLEEQEGETMEISKRKEMKNSGRKEGTSE